MYHLVSSLTKNIAALRETIILSLKPIISLRHKLTTQNTELNANQKESDREVGEEKYLAFTSWVHINIFTQYADMYSSKLSSKHRLNIF